MANEAAISVSLRISKGGLYYQSLPSSFRADVDGSGGPTPGAFTATTAGTDVDLSALSNPGLCRIQNLSDTYYVEVGVWNADQSEFYPMLRLLPAESFIVRLSPLVNQEYSGVGTGTTGELNTLRVKAESQPCLVLVEAFEA